LCLICADWEEAIEDPEEERRDCGQTKPLQVEGAERSRARGSQEMRFLARHDGSEGDDQNAAVDL